MQLLKNGEIDLNFKEQNDIIPTCMSLRFLAVYRLLAKLINVDVSSSSLGKCQIEKWRACGKDLTDRIRWLSFHAVQCTLREKCQNILPADGNTLPVLFCPGDERINHGTLVILFLSCSDLRCACLPLTVICPVRYRWG